jgi:hypothetical protein
LFFWVLELVISYSYSTRTQEPRFFSKEKDFPEENLISEGKSKSVRGSNNRSGENLGKWSQPFFS